LRPARVEAYDESEVIVMVTKLVMGFCLVLSLAACATHPSAPGVGNTVAAANPEQVPTGCVGSTATRLPVRPGDCAGFGSTHSRSSIDRTGQTSLPPALQMIDPTIQAHGSGP